MVATLGRISGGSGYEYLTNSVATGAHDYYSGAGEAAGRWHGAGLDRLGLSGQVAEHEMKALFGQFMDPRTVAFDANGAMVPVVDERGRPMQPVRLGAKPYVFGDGAQRQAVAGFDAQFAPSKSVSALWALAPVDVRQRIEELHDQAITEAFRYMDGHVVFARVGKDGIRQVDAEGLIVARFMHRTNRNGDPQLHTHCAILNRVWSADQGKWLSLDGRGLYRELHAAGAVYARQLEESLSAEFGIEWRAEGADRGFREIDGMPAGLIDRWSSRRREIVAHWAGLAGEYRDEHGCEPTVADRARLFQQSTLATRRPKGGGDGLHDRWEIEAGRDAATVRSLLGAGPAVSDAGLVADRDALVAGIGEGLGVERARFHRSHVAAKAGRALAGVGGAGGVVERVEALTAEVIASAEVVPISGLRIGVEPPAPLRRRSGESQYEAHGARRYSTLGVLSAEKEIIDWATSTTVHTLEPVAVAAAVEQLELATGRTLGADQLAAVKALTTGDFQLVTVIGPAGAGKTTMLRAVVDAYRAQGRKVIGLALSQNATNVLRDETGATTANIASWKLSRERSVLALDAGDLLVVDEAAMVPTRDLAEICRHAHERGARVAFVGDPLQLTSPEAGGIVSDLVGADSSVQLTDVRRFKHAWEGPASLALRDGNLAAVEVYAAHGRIIEVSSEHAAATLVADWWDDHRAGRDAVIVADTNSQAAELSALVQAQLCDAGIVEPGGVLLMDGNIAGIGDLIQTRLNDSDLVASDGRMVANRDTWKVVSAGLDGVIAQRANSSAATVVFPNQYLANHAQLAYAGTIHAVQGRTVDVARALITPGSGSSALYVAMTRGRWNNVAYTVTDGHDHEEFGTGMLSGPQAFAKALGRDDRERSARSTLAESLDSEASIATLTAQQADTARLAAGQLWHSWAGHHLDRVELARIDADPMRATILDAVSTLVGRADLGRALTTAMEQVRWAGPHLARRIAGTIYDYRDAQGTIAQPAVLDPDPAWRPPPAVGQLEAHAVALDEAIGDRRRMVEAAATYSPPAWAAQLPTPSAAPSVLSGHDRDRLIADIAVYRDTWRISDMSTLIGAEPVRRGAQQRAWQNLNDRIRRNDRDGSGLDDHLDVYDRDGNGRDDAVDAELAARVAELHRKVTSAAPVAPADPTSTRDRRHEHDREHGWGSER